MTGSPAAPRRPHHRAAGGRNGYGWRPDVPDARDFRLRLGAPGAPPAPPAAPPPAVDLRAEFPAPYDQGELGSCTANAAAALMQRLRGKAGAPGGDWVPSRLLIYWAERSAEGTVHYDAGSTLREAAKVLARWGVCDEALWPYDSPPADAATGRFPAGARAARRPVRKALDAAALHQALVYERVDQTEAAVKGALAAGLPVMFGFSVYESLYDPRTGDPRAVLPMPGGRSDRLLGGHAVVAAGYNDGPGDLDLGGGHKLPPRHFLVRNSWGAGVQAGGHFAMPFAYLLDGDLADDLWVVRTSEG